MLCELLPWDTDFWGVRIGHVNQRHLTTDSIREILDWQKSQAVNCLYFLADFDDPQTVQLAQTHDFQLVDVRVTLEWNLKRRKGARPDSENRAVVRPFQPGDLSTLEAIAKTSYTDTRFYFDQNFPRDKCNSLYMTWIRRSCEDFADQVLVAQVDGRATGYITCKKLDNANGKIDLVGVGNRSRGRGIGKALIVAALEWFTARSIPSVEIITQGRNISAQNLYQTCGFKTRSVQLWYHRWTSIPGNRTG